MGRKPLRVAVVSPHPLIRAGFAVLLGAAPDRAALVDVSASDGQLNRHDVAIYDLAGLVEHAEDDLQHLLAAEVPVVALAREPWTDLTAIALERGVAEAVSMSVTAEELLEVLERAAAGKTRTSAQRLAEARARTRQQVGLGDREFDVLELIAAGRSNLEIARGLYLSPNTIKTYIRTLYRKIGVKTRSQAIVWAVHRGLVAAGEDATPGREGDDADPG